MNYANYEGKIVEKYGVALTGWPTEPVRNPALAGSQRKLASLFADLTDGKCHWVKLSDDELEKRKEANEARAAAGEAVYKERKTTASKVPRSASRVPSDSEDNADD